MRYIQLLTFLFTGPLPRDIPYRRPSTSSITPPASPNPSLISDSESDIGRSSALVNLCKLVKCQKGGVYSLRHKKVFEAQLCKNNTKTETRVIKGHYLKTVCYIFTPETEN